MDGLLERDRELERLESGLDAAAAGSGSLLLIEGPAGIGKSELLAAVRERAEDNGFTVLDARGGEFEQSLGFGIARQLLGSTLAAAGDGGRERLLGGAASLAAPALDLELADQGSGLAPAPVGDPAAAVQHGLHWLVANLADEAPLLIAVDDLHWADGASVRWLVYLARRLGDLRALVVAALRPGEPGSERRLLAALEGEAAQILRPHALSEAASGELVRAALDEGAEDEFCAACHRVAGGNPFLLTELVEAIRQDEIPATGESVARIEQLSPETISRAVLLRLARLPEGAEPLTRAIAILGDAAEPRRAAALADLGLEQSARAADALADAAILRRGRPLRFAHPLIRAAVYEQVPPSERALAHSRAARLLAGEGAPAEEAATQLLKAEPTGDEEAVSVLRRAAADAAARAAPDASVAYLRRAFAEPPPAPIRVEMLVELTEMAMLAVDPSAFEGISEDPVAELSADPQTLIDGSWSLAPWLFLTGRLDEMTSILDRSIDAAEKAGDHALALEVEALALSVVKVKPEEAVARLESHADRIEPGTIEERAWLAMRGWWQHLLGGPAADSADYARRGLEGGELLEAYPVAPAIGQAILVLMRADELDEAERRVDQLLDDALRRGPAIAAGAFGVRSFLAFRRGDLASAEADARRAVELTREHGVVFGLAVNMRWLLDVLIEIGELDQAQAELESSGFDGPLPDFWWFWPLRFGRARLRLEQGRIEEGIEQLEDVLEREGATRPASDPVASTLALALDSLDRDPERVARLLDWELECAREWGTPRAIGVALRALGLVEGGGRGIELLREAVEALERSPARIEQARALTDLGAALRRAKRRTESRDPLRRAVEIAHRCGAKVIERRARDELTASGARPRRVMLSGVESLTPSELRVARMAAEGMENRAIAQELFVSVKTVETHLGHVYGKLEIASRKELPAALGG